MRGFRYVVLAALLATGIYSLPAQQAPGRPRAARITALAKTHPTPGSPLAASLARGSVVYKNVCLTCHQADGGGVPNMNPTLIKTNYVLGDKKRLIGIVLNGLKGPNEIDGETYKNNMPAQAYLTDLNVADVLTYVRNSFGNKAGAIAPTEVHALRDAPAAGQ